MRKKTLQDQVIAPGESGPALRAIDTLLGALKKEKADRFRLRTVDEAHGIDVLFEFRFPENSGDIRGQNKEGTLFMKRILDGILFEQTKKGAKLPPPYVEALRSRVIDGVSKDLDADDIVTAWIIHYWSHPSDKITEVQALTLVAVAPKIANDLVSGIDEYLNSGVAVMSTGGVLEKKSN